MSCELQFPVPPNEAKGGLIRKPERTTVTSVLAQGSLLFVVCVCVYMRAHACARVHTLGVWMGVKDPGIKFTGFSLVLTLTQHPAKEFTVRKIKIQRQVVTFGNCHCCLGKYIPTHRQGCF